MGMNFLLIQTKKKNKKKSHSQQLPYIKKNIMKKNYPLQKTFSNHLSY